MPDRISWTDFPRLRDSDAFQVTERPGVADAVTISLRSGPNMTWWKELRLIRLRDNRTILGPIQTQDADHGPTG